MLFSLLFLVILSPLHATIDVCIIGGGLAGSSTAYFLRHSSLSINVYESQDHVGGRVSSFEHSGVTIEAGASIYHIQNLYMHTLSSTLSLNTTTPGESAQRMGIFNGKAFVWRTTGWKYYDMLTLFWRYGMQLSRMDTMVSSLLKLFADIYTVQDAGEVFHSPHALLQRVGTFFFNFK